jgi:D-alanyl-D-alanine carboxypeptidase
MVMLDSPRVPGHPGMAFGESARRGIARLVHGGIGAVALGAVLALVLALAGPAVASGQSSPRQAALTEAIERVQRELSIPGAIVGVWQPGSAPYVKTFGVRDTATGRPMRTNLHMRIGSETKTFTGTALLQLVDRGRVGLDDPIGNYIDGVPSGNEITIRELAEMRSGLPSYTQNKDVLLAAAADPWRQWTPHELLAYSFSEPLLFAPGTSYHYSNTNTVLLGLVVEKVSHQPLATYIEQHILRPLHLEQTSLPTGAAFPSPHAQGYTNFTLECLTSAACDTIVNATSWDTSWAWAAGAMVSTLRDLRRWGRAVATGKLLTRATQNQRTRFIATDVEGVGYGLALADSNGWIGHDGRLFGYESTTFYLPAQRATIVVLINTNDVTAPLSSADFVAQAITGIITPEHVYVPW